LKILSSPRALLRISRELRGGGASIGFVPTMGALHEGHLALIRRARRQNDQVVASIFVNPLQFGPREDFSAYPRPRREDRARLREEGVDLLFEPEPVQFYPHGFSTQISVQGLDAHLCGPFRPGHFSGVATVVCKLLMAAEPDRLYLGQKDFQQARILERMAEDLNFPVRVVICPTVREPDGLAMSSRNRYLSAEERVWAPEIYAALRQTAAAIDSRSLRSRAPAERALARSLRGGPGRLQYAEVLSSRSLLPVDPLEGELVVAVAYLLGKARLIDNVLVRLPGSKALPAKSGGSPATPRGPRSPAPRAKKRRRRS
jgi:pantoate--beta-alanine ligase